MNISPQEIQAWTRDFYNALIAPKSASFIGCFEPTIEGQPNEDFRRVLRAVRDVMAMELPLSKAMSLFPDVFDANFLCIIRYGEIHGELDVVLERYLDHPEDRAPRCRVPAPAA